MACRKGITPRPWPSSVLRLFAPTIFKPSHIFTSLLQQADVQRDWPFLWLNVRASCCKSYVEQRALELKVREAISQKMLVDLERSLDLLLGLITYLSWAVEKLSRKAAPERILEPCRDTIV
ncbi:hypothetical protein ACCO45_009535 [Purpureocillium lilacinum]|uniref:Uncharacterized protein n=1 Tax=Purpureocillium lilacinum TaxID=33203 RepID=A0ACC4DK46_PURLI